MSSPGKRSGRIVDQAKVMLHSALQKRNLDLVRNPFSVQIATAMKWLELGTVLDIGGNIGQYGASLRASGYRGRIISCEPLSDAFPLLAKRASGDAGWTALNTAVGSEPGEIEINVSANSYSSSVLPMTDAHSLAAPGSEYVRAEKVPLVTIADIVASERVDAATTLLKIDTQGYESQVLDGAGELLASFAAVQLELSMVPLYDGAQLFGDLVARMENAGFGIFALEGGFADPRTGRMLQCDGFFLRNDLMPDASGRF
ncbi:FkbM family methyltransferase [Marmoricola sp. OAE513]|uniref:FkbM family methyltransferase n=1 Tax=Marmoricola sp. OAE513 TaxID=2817894 RepID=UPI001AE6E87A